MIIYRGKYPTRINAVWTDKAKRGYAMIQLNDGAQYEVAATATHHKLPRVGQDLTDMGDARYIGHSQRRMAK